MNRRASLTAAAALAAPLLCAHALAAEAKAPAVKLWVASSLQRVFPNSPASEAKQIDLLAARNYQVSFQACIRNQSTEKLAVRCDASGPAGVEIQVRRVGYVPMPHHTPGVDPSELDGLEQIPGLVPDPLFPEQVAQVGPSENQSFWITVKVPAGEAPGMKALTVRMSADPGQRKPAIPLGELTAQVNVRPLILQPRHGFPVTHWWHADAIYTWYKIEPFGEQWWKLVEAYMRDMVAHGSNTITVPLWHQRTEIVSRPPQLLGIRLVGPDKYEFDWSATRRFIDLARRCGMEYFEMPHLWLYWEVKYPVHIYREENGEWKLLWPAQAPATTGPFRAFLEQFLPSLHEFLVQEKILDHTYFHISDEPGGEIINNYRAARVLLHQLAPWADGKVLDALSDINYGRQGLVDIPVPILQSAQKYIDAGIPHWVYFCTWPRGPYLNRLFDTPLPKIRMSGFLFYRLGAKGFLHWGYDYWFRMNTQQVEDVFQEGAGGDWPGIPYGDPFVVYPGKDGPIDSLRWEVFAEGLQDYALLQTAGIAAGSPLLSGIKSYADFPKNAGWIEQTLQKILSK